MEEKRLSQEELQLNEYERSCVNGNNLIQAIASVRRRLDLPLHEAKALVENEARHLGWTPPQERMRAVRKEDLAFVLAETEAKLVETEGALAQVRSQLETERKGREESERALSTVRTLLGAAQIVLTGAEPRHEQATKKRCVEKASTRRKHTKKTCIQVADGAAHIANTPLFVIGTPSGVPSLLEVKLIAPGSRVPIRDGSRVPIRDASGGGWCVNPNRLFLSRTGCIHSTALALAYDRRRLLWAELPEPIQGTRTVDDAIADSTWRTIITAADPDVVWGALQKLGGPYGGEEKINV